MSKVKICGIKSLKDVEVVNKYRPDYVGFVFAPGRKRTVDDVLAKAMREALDPQILSVGVFVDAPLEQVERLLKDDVIQIAQLHGHEDISYVQALKQNCDKPVIKAFVIRSKEDVQEALLYPCDYYLLDGGLGQGQTFDWSLVGKIHKPFFLAGGLSVSNVEEAIEALHPYAVDVSSGVETDGVKDEEKIKEFINCVRAMEKEK